MSRTGTQIKNDILGGSNDFVDATAYTAKVKAIKATITFEIGNASHNKVAYLEQDDFDSLTQATKDELLAKFEDNAIPV